VFRVAFFLLAPAAIVVVAELFPVRGAASRPGSQRILMRRSGRFRGGVRYYSARQGGRRSKS
jgi:hypothetical protein